MLLDVCFTAALPLLCRCFTAAFPLIFWCFTAALLLLYYCLEHIQTLRILAAKHRAERDWQDQVSSARLKARALESGTQFTCFTSTKVQILTQNRGAPWRAEVLNLLALLVQKGQILTRLRERQAQERGRQSGQMRRSQRFSVYSLY